MDLRFVWIELGELIAISRLITKNDHDVVDSLSGDISARVKSFARDIASAGAWNTRTLVSSFSELGEHFLIFATKDFKDGEFITLERTMKDLNDFEERRQEFFSSVIGSYFGDKKQFLKNCSRDKFLDFLQSQRTLSKFSTWFLTQMLIFPQHTKEILNETLGKLLQSYTNNKLRDVITNAAHETLRTLAHSHSKEILVERLKHLSKEPLGGHVILSVQHLLPNFIFKPVKLNEGPLFLLGDTMSIELSKYNYGSDLLKEFLKDLSDKTRFCILKALSNEPMYVAQLAEHCGLSKATISHHLSALGKLGILRKSNSGRKVYYSLNKGSLKKIIENINSTLLKAEDNQ